MNFSKIYRQFYTLRGKASVSCDSTHRFIIALRFSSHWLWRQWLWRRVVCYMCSDISHEWYLLSPFPTVSNCE